jgi:hypothetical protein
LSRLEFDVQNKGGFAVPQGLGVISQVIMGLPPPIQTEILVRVYFQRQGKIINGFGILP